MIILARFPAAAACAAIVVALALSAGLPEARADARAQYRAWIEQMKQEPRGPFDSVKWFCKDGTVLPPAAYACQPHGGGHQHGQWSAQTRELRTHGYYVANLLADLDPPTALAAAEFTEQYRQLLSERYLMAVDDGWIMRRALFYRGAIQEEDERAGGRALLLALAGRPEWISLHYPELRIGVRALPHGAETASVQRVRQLAASLAERDPGFRSLRIAVTAKNFGPDSKFGGWSEEYQTESENVRLPLDFRAGIAMDFLDGEQSPHLLTVVLEGNYPNDGPEKVHLGASYGYDDTFFLRRRG